MVRKKGAVESFGRRVQDRREKMGMTIETLAHETGYQPEVIAKVEEDGIVPPVGLVIQLSRVLKLTVEELESGKGAKALEERTKSHKKRVASYAYTPLTQPRPNQHLRAYLVAIAPREQHKGVEYHHEGEEFIFVLKGGLTIKIGDNISTLSKGENIHFNSGLHHELSNPTAETTKLLVVVYVP